MIRPDFRPEVPFEARYSVRLFCTVAPDFLRIEHPLPVIVVPAPVVATPDGYGFGVFVGHRGKCHIWLAGALRDEKQNYLAKSENTKQVLQSLAHELAHYEQWRDGRKLTERGVAVRARGIIRAFKRHPLVVETVEVLKARS